MPAAVFVNVNDAGGSPMTDAATPYVPTTLLAVGTGDVAMPDVLVVAVTEVAPPNLAPAPVDGAVKITGTPATGFDELSVTRACSALPNAVPTVALCGVPERVTID